MTGAISLKWALISVVIALAFGLVLTRFTDDPWAPPVAMGVLMGALLGLGRVGRTWGGRP
jgi:hypothetical protein